MRIAVVSDTGLGLGLAMRCAGDGHDVSYVGHGGCGEGLVDTKVAPTLPDLIIFDGHHHSTQAETARLDGRKVLGSSRWAATIDENVDYRKNLLLALGLPQEPLTQGIHLYVTGWFNGASFICKYASLVYRRFMAGGAGPDLACVGMVSNFEGLTARTNDLILRPFEKALKKVNHRGCLHVHAIVDGQRFSIKEVFTSLLHPLSLLLYENTNLTASDILLKVLDPTSRPIKTTSPWACGLQLSVPPYPSAEGQIDASEISGIIPANLKHLWMSDVVKANSRHFICGSGMFGYVLARGSSENECVRRMYRTVENLQGTDLQYRNDVGKNAQSLLFTLRQSGWLA